MYRSLPSLRALRALEAVARHGSMSAAAEELHVTQGAISHRIRSLEEDIGAELFIRDGSRLKLTAEAHALLPTIKSTFERLNTAIAELGNAKASGELSVYSVPAFLSYWLMPRLHRFLAIYPNISLNCGAIGYDASPSDPEGDVMIRCGSGHWPGVTLRLLSRFEDFPVCSPALLNSRPIRSLRDLESHTLLHADDGVPWSNWLAQSGGRSSPAMRHQYFANAHLAIEAAIHGNGLALGDSITVRTALELGTLVEPLAMRVPSMSSFYLAFPPGRESSPLTEAFVNWIVSEIGGTGGTSSKHR